jgi:hypothetical protein
MAGKGRGKGKAGSRRANRDEGSDVSDYRRKTRAGKRARGKGSCAPKLFMLLLPLAAVGTFVFLKA